MFPVTLQRAAREQRPAGRSLRRVLRLWLGFGVGTEKTLHQTLIEAQTPWFPFEA
jgi:hypothetical protein